MKLLFDLFPVILFFAAFSIAGKSPESASSWLSQIGLQNIEPAQAPILTATVIVILATLVQIGWVWFRHGRIDKMLKFSLALVIVFGGLTLYFRDPFFIKLKLTILYWGFSIGMFVASFVFKKNAIRSMLGEQLDLPERIWRRVNASWIGFFMIMGAINLYIAYNFSEATWVNFKVFGSTGLLFTFVLAQGFVLSKYIEEKK